MKNKYSPPNDGVKEPHLVDGVLWGLIGASDHPLAPGEPLPKLLPICWLPEDIDVRLLGAEPCTPGETPRFDRDTGELKWRGRTIGTFQLRDQCTVPERILQALQGARWPHEIPNPLGSGKVECLAIHGHVNYLNEAINEGTISFHVKRGGKIISWRH
jgi:hypothetical protein